MGGSGSRGPLGRLRIGLLLHLLLLVLTACHAGGTVGAAAPSLPQCPAFSDAADPHACVCEIANSSTCRGVTPRFNWIIGLCERPRGEPGVGGTDDAAFPGPPGSFKCADPMRLRPDDTAASNVSLRYLAAYQWGNPCEEALAAHCPGSNTLLLPDSCKPCVVSKKALLLRSGCTATQLPSACDLCTTALRNATWGAQHQGVHEKCGNLQGNDCHACLGENQKLRRSGCTNERLDEYCQRNWGLALESSKNTDAATELIDLPGLVQPGGAAMWNSGAYLRNVRGLRPPGTACIAWAPPHSMQPFAD